jgi:TIR domain
MPVGIFFSYAHTDEDLRDRLEEHLSILVRQGLVVTWHDRQIPAGDNWANAIAQRLNAADIILLFFKRILRRHDSFQNLETTALAQW